MVAPVYSIVKKVKRDLHNNYIVPTCTHFMPHPHDFHNELCEYVSLIRKKEVDSLVKAEGGLVGGEEK